MVSNQLGRQQNATVTVLKQTETVMSDTYTTHIQAGRSSHAEKVTEMENGLSSERYSRNVLIFHQPF